MKSKKWMMMIPLSSDQAISFPFPTTRVIFSFFYFLFWTIMRGADDGVTDWIEASWLSESVNWLEGYISISEMTIVIDSIFSDISSSDIMGEWHPNIRPNINIHGWRELRMRKVEMELSIVESYWYRHAEVAAMAALARETGSRGGERRNDRGLPIKG
jgi:hypothetical protein